MLRVPYLAAVCFIFVSTAVAHPGRTDANGGHYNRKTGEYHYHNSGRSSAPAVIPSSIAPTSQPQPAARPVRKSKPTPVPEPDRTNWHDTSGKLIAYGHVVAAYDRIGWQAWIKKRDGSTVNVKLSDLSVADRAFVLAAQNQPGFKEKYHLWKSNNGKFTVNAKALEIEAENVRLRREDKKVITVPLAKISFDDRQYVANLYAASKPPGSKPLGGKPVGDNPFATR